MFARLVKSGARALSQVMEGRSDVCTYFVRPLTRFERNRLDAILRKPPNVEVFLRAQAVGLSSQGWKVPETARVVHRDRSVVSRWLHQFEQEWIEGLWPRKSPGRPPKVTPEFRQAASQAARKNPRELGYEFTRWTTALLAEHLARTTGIKVGPATVRNTLVELGFRWGRAKLDLAHRCGPCQAPANRRFKKTIASRGRWNLGRFQNYVLNAGGRVITSGRRLVLYVARAVVPFWKLLVGQIATWKLPPRWTPPRGARRRPWNPPSAHAHLQEVLRW